MIILHSLRGAKYLIRTTDIDYVVDLGTHRKVYRKSGVGTTLEVKETLLEIQMEVCAIRKDL